MILSRGAFCLSAGTLSLDAIQFDMDVSFYSVFFSFFFLDFIVLFCLFQPRRLTSEHRVILWSISSVACPWAIATQVQCNHLNLLCSFSPAHQLLNFLSVFKTQLKLESKSGRDRRWASSKNGIVMWNNHFYTHHFQHIFSILYDLFVLFFFVLKNHVAFQRREIWAAAAAAAAAISQNAMLIDRAPRRAARHFKNIWWCSRYTMFSICYVYYLKCTRRIVGKWTRSWIFFGN